MWRNASRSRVVIFLSIILILAFVPFFASRVFAATIDITVNSIADDTLGNLALNTTCDLREAIQAANTRTNVGQCSVGAAVAGDNFRIIFDMTGLGVGPFAINISTPLPIITSPSIILEGNYNGGSDLIRLEATGVVSHGLRLGVSATDPTILASNAVIQGFQIDGFQYGIVVASVPGAQIGNPVADGQNVLINNSSAGLLIDGTGVTSATVQNNFIGLLGTTPGPNVDGIVVSGGAESVTIGGAGLQANLISANVGNGIFVSNSPDLVIEGNTIGRDDSGLIAFGNGLNGMLVSSSINPIIQNNIVANSGFAGIRLQGVTGGDILSNDIGFGAGAGAGNASNGITIITSTNVTIEQNQISNNGGDGVGVASGTGIRISDNLISNNGGLGIDLGANGVNANDVGDADVGANNLLNYPVITNAATDGTDLQINGSLSVAPGSYTLEVYNAATCDPSGFGEAESLLFSGSVTAGAFTLTASGGTYTVGSFVKILTIDASDNTSELSRCFPISQIPVPNFTPRIATILVGTPISFTNLSTGFITAYDWDFGNGLTATTRDAATTYSVPGIYTVTMTVTDGGGLTYSITGTITVVIPTPTPVPTATSLPSLTPIPPTATITPSPTATIRPTNTPRPTSTPRPTNTPRPTVTSTNTRVPTLTSTLRPTATQTLVPTMTNTSVPTATQTLVPTATETLVPTATLPPDIDVTKTSNGVDQVQINIVNSGQGPANNVVLQESLREEVRYISAQPGSPRCVETGGLVLCQLGIIPAGQSASVNLNLNTNGADPASGQTTVNVDGVTSAVIDEPYIIKLGQPPIAAPGAELTYTIRVINPTAQTARIIRIVDQMPEGIEILSGQSTSGNLVINGQNITLTQATLLSGERITITLQTRVSEDGVFNEFINEACLTSSLNVTARCAQMSFLRAGQLPNTGLTPWWVTMLQAIGMIISIGLATFGGIWWLRRR